MFEQPSTDRFSVQMSMSPPMVGPRDQALLPSRQRRMLAMPLLSSTATTGKDAISKLGRTALLVQGPDEVASVDAAALQAVLVAVVLSAAVSGDEVDSEEASAAVVASEEALADPLVDTMPMLAERPTHRTPSPTTRLQVASRARLSTFAM